MLPLLLVLVGVEKESIVNCLLTVYIYKFVVKHYNKLTAASVALTLTYLTIFIYLSIYIQTTHHLAASPSSLLLFALA